MTRIVYFLFYALSLLPFRILYGMADIGYVLLFYIIRYRRGVVHRNLVTVLRPRLSCGHNCHEDGSRKKL